MKTTENETIDDLAPEVIATGKCTDLMGNNIISADFVSVDPGCDKDTFILSVVFPKLRKLEGKILTIIDASYESSRAKFVKDLVKDSFCEYTSGVADIMSECRE